VGSATQTKQAPTALALRSLRSKLQIHLKISATVLALVNDVALTRYRVGHLSALCCAEVHYKTNAGCQDTGKQIIILLCGGDKSTQQRNIESARRLAGEPEEEEYENS
jgi:hypothetical protein